MARYEEYHEMYPSHSNLPTGERIIKLFNYCANTDNKNKTKQRK